MLRIGFISFPGFPVMSFASMAVFEAANRLAREPHYDIRVLSETGGAIQTSLGVAVQTEAIGSDYFDTTIICGGGKTCFTPGLLDCLRHAAQTGRRLAATCTGTFFLAEAGLLDGLRVTTHWFHAEHFRARYPRVILEPERLFVIDGPIWTSAGMTAGIDQALAMVEQDLGSDIAKGVSKRLVLQSRRSGCQPQSSVLLDICPKTDRIHNALAFARSNLHTALTIAQLADAARLSPRQFSRAFRLQTGVSPAKAVEKLRVEAASALVQDGRLTIEEIARQTGFGDNERMRRAFVRAFGRSPQVVRRIARGEMGIPMNMDAARFTSELRGGSSHDGAHFDGSVGDCG